jgi:antitoxin ParD1/3/4
MNVNLTPALADFVEHEIHIGDYQSASELVRDALRLLRREKERDSLKLEALRLEVLRGFHQAQDGNFADETLDEIANAILSEES